MSVASQTRTKRYTPEDLLRLPDGKRYELVDGKLVKRAMGSESSLIEGTLYFLLRAYCQAGGLGLVWPGTNGFQCFPHVPGRVRVPDVSFVRKGRLPGDLAPSGFVRIPPDLAVEVVSPRDRASELEDKLVDYRKVAIPLIWVIYPNSRTAIVYRIDGTATFLGEDDELSGEDVIPGFRCKLREILQAPAEVESPATAEAGNGKRKPGEVKAKTSRRKSS
ncbi:Uma2 family endonuclease [Aquisphaera insulae]|uniref:Uma2 family endonuclease n=1 Tax=Aquisphaera insulae TaxID=2712864 RepID=UPI0013EAB4BD|nr:Uma2 family endonuclease [Aquisphaera insulae]